MSEPRVLFLLLALAGIVYWQRGFTDETVPIDSSIRQYAGVGVIHDKQFFFFLHHLNLFPIATDTTIREDTADEARRLLRDEPQALKQESGTTFRSGDRLRTYLYLVDGWWNHRGLNVSIKPAHELAFIFALCALFTSFWSLRRTLEGTACVLLLGSNPFQLNAVYREENVFSWAITIMCVLLAIHLPLLETRRKKTVYPWFAAVLTGLVIGLVRNVRSEPSVMLASAVVVYLTLKEFRWRERILLPMVMLISLFVTARATRYYIDEKFDRASAVITEVGGSPYTGMRIYIHEFWHVVWCGLGDFDTKYGHYWDDDAAYRAIVPELQEMHPEIAILARRGQNRFYDVARKNEVYIGEIPDYDVVARRQILSDIKRDPKWYLDILYKRAKRILDSTSPIGIAFSDKTFYAKGPFVGWLCVPLVLWLAVKRRWRELKLMIFSAPLSLVAFLIYSDRGMTYYSTYHLFGALIIVQLVLTGSRSREWKRGRT